VRVSTRGDYASRALLSLALRAHNAPTPVKELAERTGLPQPYLEQILLALKSEGLVVSKRGVGGGYLLFQNVVLAADIYSLETRVKSLSRRSSPLSMGPLWPVSSASPTKTGHATMRVNVSS